MPDFDAIIAFLAVANVVAFVALALVIWSLVDNPSCDCENMDCATCLERLNGTEDTAKAAT